MQRNSPRAPRTAFQDEKRKCTIQEIKEGIGSLGLVHACGLAAWLHSAATNQYIQQAVFRTIQYFRPMQRAQPKAYDSV